MKPFLFSLCLALFLSGCASVNLQKIQSIDPNAKTITVPNGSAGVNGYLKSVLVKDGWKLFSYNGQSTTEGTIGQKVSIKNYSTITKTRYILTDTWKCDGRYYWFDISVVDNQTGSEVLTASGYDTPNSISEKFIQALR